MPLTILMTNLILFGRSGTEVVTEQLADGLRRRGHRPILFTQQAGPLAEQMRQRGHIVVSRPDAVPFAPDVIHAHHTVPAMAALVAHPGTPALFVCHDATTPYDAAPPHPRVRRLFAVDERCRARLVVEGAPADGVALLPNAVDLARIPPRGAPLPWRPARALVATKHAAHLPAIRQACLAAGIALEELGPGPGIVSDVPEAAFAAADLVFATARTALEAAAAGAGVVVCDARGCAGFLTRARAEAWLPWNLGAGILTHPPDTGTIAAAIAEWSADEAAAAAALVREERGLEVTLDRLEAIYATLLAGPVPSDAAAEAGAVGAFIAGWAPGPDQGAPWRRLADTIAGPGLASSPEMQLMQAVLLPKLDALQAEMAQTAERQADRLEALAASDADARDRLPPIVSELQSEIAALRSQISELAARRSAAQRLWDLLRAMWRRAVPYRIRAALHRLRSGAA